MPGFNRRGPRGKGPLTGRGRGLCRRAGRTDDRPTIGEEDACGLRGWRRHHGRRGADLWDGRGVGRIHRDESSLDGARGLLQRLTNQLSRALAGIEAELGDLESRVRKGV